MTLTVLLIVIAVAMLLTARGFRRSSRALFGVATLVFLLVGSGIPAAVLLKALQDGYEVNTSDWGAHNAIVLLGAGSERTDRGTDLAVFGYGRLTKALELYRGCKARGADCRIISSGGDTHHFGTSEAELYTAMLVRLGAEPADLIDEKRSQNTWQNAQFTAPLLNGQPLATGQAPLKAQPLPAGQTFDRVWLVSSGVHVYRAALYFSHFGINAGVIRADYLRAQLSVLPNSWNFLVTDLVLHEYIGVLRYHVFNLLGWNTGTARPGSP